MNFGIVIFPASNCEVDCKWAISKVNQNADFIWHEDTDLSNYDCIILPGGFSYGDYLRSGAIAKFSPIMKAVKEFAEKGGLIIGICNGFQILLEAGLLPGAMLRNKSLKFICKYTSLKVENNNTPFTSSYEKDQVVNIPIAHNEGNYFADEATLKTLKENDQIILRYSNKDGRTQEEDCPNGSVENIAGICNKDRNVFGLMPHPERAMEKLLGSADGKLMFESIIKSRESRVKSRVVS